MEKLGYKEKILILTELEKQKSHWNYNLVPLSWIKEILKKEIKKGNNKLTPLLDKIKSLNGSISFKEFYQQQ